MKITFAPAPDSTISRLQDLPRGFFYEDRIGDVWLHTTDVDTGDDVFVCFTGGTFCASKPEEVESRSDGYGPFTPFHGTVSND